MENFLLNFNALFLYFKCLIEMNQGNSAEETTKSYKYLNFCNFLQDGFYFGVLLFLENVISRRMNSISRLFQSQSIGVFEATHTWLSF